MDETKYGFILEGREFEKIAQAIVSLCERAEGNAVQNPDLAIGDCRKIWEIVLKYFLKEVCSENIEGKKLKDLCEHPIVKECIYDVTTDNKAFSLLEKNIGMIRELGNEGIHGYNGEEISDGNALLLIEILRVAIKALSISVKKINGNPEYLEEVRNRIPRISGEIEIHRCVQPDRKYEGELRPALVAKVINSGEDKNNRYAFVWRFKDIEIKNRTFFLLKPERLTCIVTRADRRGFIKKEYSVTQEDLVIPNFAGEVTIEGIFKAGEKITAKIDKSNLKGSEYLFYKWIIEKNGEDESLGNKHPKTNCITIPQSAVGYIIRCEITSDWQQGTLVGRTDTISDNKNAGGEEISGDVDTQNKLTGKFEVVKDEKSKSEEVVLFAQLSESNVDFQHNGVIFDWGMTCEDGTYRSLKKGEGESYATFKCDLSPDVFQSIFRCTLTCEGYKGKLTAEFRKLTEEDFRIQAELSIKPESMEMESGNKSVVLRAVVKNTNFSEQLCFVWSKNGVVVENEITNAITIKKEDIGSSYICEITHKERTFSVISEPYVVEEELFAILPVDSPSDETGEKIEPIEGNGENTGKQPKGRALITFDPPKTINAPKFQCFNAAFGRPQYFVAPRDDYYATNSLEYLDYNAYLYSLLKDQGYDRVIIVGSISEDGGYNYPVIAYDKLSRLSFLMPSDFVDYCEKHNKNGKIDKEILEGFCDACGSTLAKNVETATDQMLAEMGVIEHVKEKPKSDVLPKYGRQNITNIRPNSDKIDNGSMSGTSGKTPKEGFDYFVKMHVGPALESSVLKTAVVMPLELLLEPGYLSNETRSELKTALNCSRVKGEKNKKAARENLLVITATQVDDLYRLMEDSLKFCEIDTAVNRAVEKIRKSQAGKSYSNEFGIELSLAERILECQDHPGTDEIANLLLWRKLNEPQLFKDIPYSKIYSLADFLSENCFNSADTATVFPKLKHNEWNVKRLLTLDSVLDEEDVAIALSEKANELHTRQVNIIEGLYSTTLERIYEGKNRLIRIQKANKESKSDEKDIIFRIEKAEKSEEEKTKAYEEAAKELGNMIGLGSVKQSLNKSWARVKFDKNTNGPGHFIFAGNPGTGKTVVARLFGKILCAQGLIKKGHLVEVGKADLVSEHVGESAIKTLKKCEEALDGVLFLDEAYQLVNTDENASDKFPSSFDREAYETLMAFMENNRTRICVICAGYPYEMRKFREANPGMARRIPEKNVISFPDYSADELFDIMQVMARADELILTDSFKREAKTALSIMWENRDSQFGNAGDVRNFLEECRDNASERAMESGSQFELDAVDIPEIYRQKPLTEDERKKLLAESMKHLDDFVGLDNVKEWLERLIALRVYSNTSDQEPGNYIFAGNPGTGKTEVARIIGEIFKASGILRKGHTVEVSKADLVAEYVGQSAIKTREQCRKALDGVLFVDEAYELVNTGTGLDKFSSKFDEEAYTTIMKFMEDNASRICVIFAGYEEEMQIFVKANPGMKRRITEIIHFDDYSVDELIEILKLKAERMSSPNINLTPDFIEGTRRILGQIKREEDFGNAGFIVKYLTKCRENAAFRNFKAGGNVGSLTLTKEDLPDEYKETVVKNASQHGDLKTGKKASAPLDYSKIEKEEITGWPNPYKDMDIHSNEFKEYCCKSVILVTTEYGSATAFIITPTGYAVTCAHALIKQGDFGQIAKKLTAYLKDPKTELQFTIRNINYDIDLALIKIESDFSLPYLRIAPKERNILLTESFTLYGYPDGREGILTFSGNINSEEEEGPDGELGKIRYLDGTAFYGDSGGPIIAESDGCVIGVLKGAHKMGGGNINYMKPIRYFWEEFFN